MDVKIIQPILSKIEFSDINLLNHLERTATLCYASAKELDFDAEELEIAYMAGLVHEIGRVNFFDELQVQDNIDIDKIYPYLTISMLSMLKDFNPLIQILSEFQENVDGSGYPKGLIGEQINPIAKILRIADFYDTQRAKNLTHDQTTKLLRENSDIIFPRRIITPFIKSIIKNELQFDY